MTTITTAARRIARELNATPETIEVSFDADGNVVDRHEAGMWYADPADRPAYVVRVRGRQRSQFGRIAQARAQELLNDAAAGF